MFLDGNGHLCYNVRKEGVKIARKRDDIMHFFRYFGRFSIFALVAVAPGLALAASSDGSTVTSKLYVDAKLGLKQDASTAVTHTANTKVGSATQPVYVDTDGTVKATTYTLGKSVPSDAKFTDTTYDAMSSSELTTGTSTTGRLVTPKLLHDELAAKQGTDTAVTHTADTAVGGTTTPVYIASDGKATALSYTIAKSVPADAKFTDTTYDAMSSSELTTGTSTTGRLVTPKLLHDELAAKQGTDTAVTHTASTAVGSGTNGVYVDANGVVTAMTYSLNKTVPADAKFTDTTYTADETTIAKSSGNQFSAKTGSVTSTATTLTTGKQVYDYAAPKTTAVTHTASTAVGSGTNGVYVDANGVVTAMTYSLNKTVPADAKFTDTTYDAMSSSELTTGTSTTGRLITPKLLHDELAAKQGTDTAVTHTAGTAVGGTTTPVYIASDGTATALSYTIAKSVPADAKFTDTTYSADDVTIAKSSGNQFSAKTGTVTSSATTLTTGTQVYNFAQAKPSSVAEGKVLTYTGSNANSNVSAAFVKVPVASGDPNAASNPATPSTFASIWVE